MSIEDWVDNELRRTPRPESLASTAKPPNLSHGTRQSLSGRHTRLGMAKHF